MRSPEEIIKRMDELIKDLSNKDTAPLDESDPIAEKHRDAIRRQAEGEETEDERH